MSQGTAYYNDSEPFVCNWLSNLMDAGWIMPGTIDNRSIRDVTPEDVQGFTQVHFFAGIGGWPLALTMAGWRDDTPVWTGSCPCQPFSVAGKKKGSDDERDVWPQFRNLIEQCRPPVVFGEQVASKLGRAWFSAVRTDLEALGYACGAADLCAAGIGAPHIRQRLYWVADARDARRWQNVFSPYDTQGTNLLQQEGAEGAVSLGICGSDGRLGHSPSDDERRPRQSGESDGREGSARGSGTGGSGLGNADCPRYEIGTRDARDDGAEAEQEGGQTVEQAGPWDNCVLIPCADGKARPTPDPESGIFPLAHGIPGRVGRLRAYGNAIVPPLAATFIMSCMEIYNEKEA